LENVTKIMHSSFLAQKMEANKMAAPAAARADMSDDEYHKIVRWPVLMTVDSVYETSVDGQR
jgi:hypothetical protein